MIPRRVNSFYTTIRIIHRNLNQNLKYFNPLVRGQGTTGSNDEKNGGRKSRWNVVSLVTLSAVSSNAFNLGIYSTVYCIY